MHGVSSSACSFLELRSFPSSTCCTTHRIETLEIAPKVEGIIETKKKSVYLFSVKSSHHVLYLTGLSANFIYLKSPKEVSRRVSAAEEPEVGIPRLC